MQSQKMLGAILVERNILCALTVDRVAAIADKMQKRLGVVLEEMGLITEEELAHALALRYNLRPLVNFAKASFPQQVLELLPAEVALQYMLFPLKLEGRRLALAMADPSDMKIVDNMAANNGLTIVPFVSTKREIKEAICRHYFGKDATEPTGRTILIVEDDRLLLEVMEQALSRYYRVITAVDGLDAYKEVISKRPQVVLTDKAMPKLGGYELLGALRAVPETKQIPIILVSGSTSATIESEAFEKGFFDFIQKPVKESTLLTRVRRAFEYSEKQNYLFLR